MERKNNDQFSIIDQANKIVRAKTKTLGAAEQPNVSLETPLRTSVNHPRFLRPDRLSTEDSVALLLGLEDGRRKVQRKMQFDNGVIQKDDTLTATMVVADGVLEIEMELQQKNYGDLHITYTKSERSPQGEPTEFSVIEAQLGIHGDFELNIERNNYQE